MTAATLPKPLWFSVPALIVAVSALALAGFAQSAATGTVQGRVYNPATQEYVRNAEVRLEGTNQIVYTENDGSFQFTGVSAGAAVIRVTYSGYKSVSESFTVTAGQAAVREINLTSTAAASATKDGVVQLGAFTVSSEREGNAKAIMEQRRSMDIITSVSSDIFGDVTDGNVGEFLKYLPGVDLDYVESEARGPKIGGMEGQYVGVMFDGIKTASADANRGGGDASRATSFEGFSITSIESIEISRTRSADSDGDSAAGSINMRTRRAFDRRGRRLSFNYSMNFNAEEFTLNKKWGPDENKNFKWKPNYQFEYSESFFAQRFGINLGASRANSYTEQYSFNYSYSRSPSTVDPRPMVVRVIDIKDGPKFIQKDALSLTADWKVTRNLVLSLNAIYTYTEGEFWNRNFTFTAANDNNNVNNGRPSIRGNGLTVIQTTRGTANTVPAIAMGGGSSSKLTYTRTFAPKFEYRLNAWTFEGALSMSRSVNNYEALERGFSENEALSLGSDFIATRPRAESWEWTIRQTSGPDWFNLANWSGGTRVENSGREWATEIWNGQLSARYVLPFFRAIAPVIKIGGRWNEESRDNNNEDAMRIWRYIGPGGDVMTGRNATTGVPTITTSGNWARLGFQAPHEFDTGTSNGLTVTNIAGITGHIPRADRNRIAGLFRSSPELFVNTATPDNYYTSFIVNKRDFRQTITAGYAQADARLSRQITVRAGVRFERTDNALTEWDPRFRDDVVARGFPVDATGRATTVPGLQYQFQSQPRVTREASYHNFFPSVSGRYHILRDLELQAGYSKAISRPPIDSLTGLWDIDENATDTLNLVNAPNPNLKPEDIKKYDARLAYYWSGRGAGSRSPGQISLAVSQFDIRNLRESHDFTAEEFGIDDPEFAKYTFRATRNSDRSRRQRSMEFSYQQTLGFLPSEYLRGTSFNVAYTRLYASSRRNGMAPHRVTSRLGYAYRRFNGSLGMVWIDRRPDGNYGFFRPEQTQFDLTLNWRLTSRLTLYTQGRNITNQVVKWMVSPPGVAEGESPALRQVQEYGANWVFGVRGTF